jgi:hypothetical protein
METFTPIIPPTSSASLVSPSAPAAPATPATPPFFSTSVKGPDFEGKIKRVSPPPVRGPDGSVVGLQHGGNDLFDVASKALSGDSVRVDLVDIFEQFMNLASDMIKEEMVHGDIKLENALIDDDGRVTLIDFAGSAMISGTAQGVQYQITDTTPLMSLHPTAMGPLFHGRGIAFPSSIHDMYGIANTMLVLCMCFSGVKYVGAEKQVPISDFWHPHGRGEDETVEAFLGNIVRASRVSPSEPIEDIMARFSVRAVCAGHIAVAEATTVKEVKHIMKIVCAIHLAIDTFIRDNPLVSTRDMSEEERVVGIAKEQELCVAVIDATLAALSVY